MKYKWIVLTLLTSALWGCKSHQKTDEGASKPDFVSTEYGVTVETGSQLEKKLTLRVIEPQTLDAQFKTTASVGAKSGSIAEIGLPFGGRVIRSFVRLGDQVHRGQVLFEVNSSDYMETVKDYLESRSASNLATANQKRKEALYQRGMLSDREWEEICAESRNAENAFEDYISGKRSFMDVSADFKRGRVVRNELVIGGYLNEEDEAPMTVADLSTIWVTANVKTSQISGLALGQMVKVEFEAGRQMEGKIFYLGELLDEKTQTLPVVIECVNTERSLKPGMFVSAIFERHAISALIVPSSAIFQGEGNKYVYVQDSPGHFNRVQVIAENIEKGQSRILSGLSGGETIIVDGGIYLNE